MRIAPPAGLDASPTPAEVGSQVRPAREQRAAAVEVPCAAFARR